MSDAIINGSTYPLPDEVTAGKTALYNAAIMALASMTEAAWEAWDSWTPTLTNAAIGTGGGAAVSAKYQQIGKLVICRLVIILGSSGASVTGVVQFSLPVTSISYPGSANSNVLGDAQSFDTSAGFNYGSKIVWNTTTTALVATVDTSGTYAKSVGTGTNAPFTWAAGDEIHAQFMYEAA